MGLETQCVARKKEKRKMLCQLGRNERTRNGFQACDHEKELWPDKSGTMLIELF